MSNIQSQSATAESSTHTSPRTRAWPRPYLPRACRQAGDGGALRRWKLLAALVCAAACGAAYGTPTTATWNGSTADWSTGADWSTSPHYPQADNPTGVYYVAQINQSGAGPYTLTLDSSFNSSFPLYVDGITINNTNATFDQPGGTFADLSQLDVSGTPPGALNVQAGTYELAGGTLADAVLTVGGTGVFNLTNGTFQNVTLGSNLTLNNNSAYLSIANTVASPNGLTPNGNGITLSGNSSSLYFTDAYSSGYIGQTIDNTAINLTGNGASVQGGSGTLTIGAHATIAGLAANSSNTLGGSDIVNNGVIDASTSANGETLYLDPSSFTNNGTISVDANLQLSAYPWSNTSTGLISVSSGGVADFSGTWSNAGTIQGASGATFNLGGTFHPADVGLASSGTNGTFTPNGSTVNLTGILNNTSNTLTFGSTSGVWNLVGGTIQNGTLIVNNQTNGQPYLEIHNGTFQNVTLGSNLTLNNSNAYLSIANTVANPTGLTPNGNGITLSGNGSVLNFQDAYSSGYIGQTIDNTALNLTGANAYVEGGSGTLTIGAHATIAGLAANSSNTLGGSDIVNNGVIDASTSANGETLYLNPSSFTNNNLISVSANLQLDATNWSNSSTGLITVSSGEATFYGNWSNTGAIQGFGATFNLGGTFHPADVGLASSGTNGTFTPNGSTVNLTGILDNTSNTLTFGSGSGVWNLVGGTIQNGTVVVNNQSGGQPYLEIHNGTFQNVTLGSNLTLNNSSSYLYIANTVADPTGLTPNGNGITLSGNSSSLYFTDAYSSGYIGQTIDNTAINLTGNGASVQGGSGTLTIGAHATIAGLAANSSNTLGGSDIVNNGVIDASTSANGETLYLNPSSFTNNNLISVSANLQLGATTWSNTSTGLISVSSGEATFYGNWSNTGAIQGFGATFNLGGTFHPADVGLASSGTNGTFTPNGSTVNLTGILNNTSNTLTFGSTSGVWNLVGGTIQNGTLIVNNQTNGQPYLEIHNGTFQNVTLGSNLTLNNSNAYLSIANTVANPTGLTPNGNGITLSGNGSVLNFQDAYSSGYIGQTIDNTVVNLTGNGAYVEGGSGTLTIGAHATIAGLAANSSNTLGGSDIVNNGVIDAGTTSNGETLYLNPSSFTNNNLISVSANLQLGATNWSNSGTGLISVSSGTATFSGNWSNTGTIQGFGATFNLGGTFHPADVGLASSGPNGTFTPNGSTVNLTGILDNTSNTLTFGSASGVWNLVGGTIQNGTVVVNNQSGGQPYLEIHNGTFQNVTLGSNLTLNNSSASLSIANTVANPTGLTPNGNGITLSGNSSLLNFQDAYSSGYIGQTIDNTALNLTGANAYVEGGNGTLTIGAHATIAGLAANSSNTLFGSTIINNGTIDAGANGETLYIEPNTTFSNNGVLEATNGGSLYVSVGFTNTGTVDVGGASTLTIYGNYTQISPGTTNVNGSLVLMNGGSLSIATGTTVNISNTSASTVNANVLINYGAPANDPNSTIRGYLVAGYNNGAWNGTSATNGVINGTTLPPAGLTIGYADGADGVVSGLAAGQEKIMVTLPGDANLSGSVGLNDLGIFRSNFGKTGMQWDQGNFNYNTAGSVGLNNLGLFRANFGKTAPAAPAASPTPEPATLALLALGGLGLLVRRSCRSE